MPSLREMYVHQLPSYFDQFGGTLIDRKGVAHATLNGGVLTFEAGYWWNGANWIPNFPSTQRGSLVHDALCRLDHEYGWGPGFREIADRELCCCVREDGGRALADAVYSATRAYQETQVPVVRLAFGLVAGALGFVFGTGKSKWPCGRALSSFVHRP